MEIKMALVGNPNSGKTTMFNELTGSLQYVGNWPGVTVEKKEGKLKGYQDVTIVDLPGIYSLSPYTIEEVVTRNFLVDESPDVIINIVDATNIERNLYLTTQLTEVGIPVVVALNMMDVVTRIGDIIDIAKLSKELGVTVMETSALKGTGLKEIAQKALAIAKAKKHVPHQHKFDPSVETVLENIESIIDSIVPQKSIRWFSVKLFERDEKVLSGLRLSDDLKNSIEKMIVDLEAKMEDDAESIITNERYNYIEKVIKTCYRRKDNGNMSTSDRIDNIVTNRWLALPIFALVMFIVYYISVTSVGTIVTDFTNDTLFGAWIQPGVQAALESAGAAEWLISLVVDGIIGGIAAPIGFAPQMAVLFLFLALLEDCGYMARVAFIMDRIFRKFGLSGKSFIPMLISSGCGVPGIMASRTIENEKDRRLTIMTTTFIPCGAKLPVIALISGAIMGGAWWMAPAMYFIGIAAVIVSGLMLKKTAMFASDVTPFVMELPRYHAPAVRNVLMHVWDRVWSFIKKAGTVLFLACTIMWFLATFGVADGQFVMVDQESSLMALLGGIIAPLFAPLGFGSWQAVAASLSGFVAKEGIVSTMAVLVGMTDAVEGEAGLWTAVMGLFPSSVAAFSFLLFNLLDSPCLAAISTIAKEMNSRKWTTFALLYQNLFAYAIALMVYQFGTFFMSGSFGIGTGVATLILVLILYLLLRPTSGSQKGQTTLPVVSRNM